MNRRLVTVSTVALSAALLSACGTGLHAQTYKEVGRADGASTNLQALQVRNLHIAPPDTAGGTITGTATVVGTLVNNGGTADALVSASTDAASSASLTDNGQPATQVAVPANGLAPGTWAITLTGLTQPLRPGSYITMTLVFDKAGRTTLQVPVRAGDNGVSGRDQLQDPYGEGK
ncbi:MAG: copper chaperone PCu(A)C [Mycobacteriales bacterium]